MENKEIERFDEAIEKAKTIEDLAEIGPVKLPELPFLRLLPHYRKKNYLIKSRIRKYMDKCSQVIKENIKDIEILYNGEGTGFDILMNLGGENCKIGNVEGDYFIKYSPKKSPFKINEKKFYNKLNEITKLTKKLGFEMNHIGGW